MRGRTVADCGPAFWKYPELTSDLTLDLVQPANNKLGPTAGQKVELQNYCRLDHFITRSFVDQSNRMDAIRKKMQTMKVLLLPSVDQIMLR